MHYMYGLRAPLRCYGRSSSKKFTNFSKSLRALSTKSSSVFAISEEIQDAIQSRKPVVALETTIYTHGLPYPENVAMASHLESLVRVHGAVPATIGVLHGVARVGFEPEELIELISSAGKPETKKLSRRDLGYICGLGIAGRKLNGGTTVAGTMFLAHLAGIKVFATGGLGGVHRGGENSMDISADLTELGRTPVAVISSGCKSFLDIPRTLEYLETQGVGVCTFADGRESKIDFPAFWTRDSGILSPLIIKDEKEAAAIIYAQSALQLSSGMLFANAIAAEDSIDKAEMDNIIVQAIHDAGRARASGSDITPFVLGSIRKLTEGRSLPANKALVEANVIRGTKVAVELARIEISREDRTDRHFTTNKPSKKPSFVSQPFINTSPEAVPSSVTSDSPANDCPNVIVAGSLAIDLSCDFTPWSDSTTTGTPQAHTSNPATITQSLGGVGQNLATAMHYLGCPVRLCSAIAHDVAGSTALEMLVKRGLQTCGITTVGQGTRTAQYVAVNDTEKELVLAMADMSILEHENIDFDTVWKSHLDSCKPKWLVVDANWNPVTLKKWITTGKSLGAKVAFEPVSAAKSTRIFAPPFGYEADLATIPNHLIDLAAPNEIELLSMYSGAKTAGLLDRQDWWQVINAMGMSSSGSRDKLVSITNSTLVDQGVPQQSIQLLPFIPCLLTKLGAQGVLLTQLLRPGDDRLTSPKSSRYILSRSHSGSEIVGGVYMRLFPSAEAVPGSQIVSVNGVGDTFLGILIAGLAKEDPKNLMHLIDIAQKGSVMSLKSKDAVSSEIAGLRSII